MRLPVNKRKVFIFSPMWVNTQLYIAHCFVCVFQFEWQRKQNKLKNRCYVPIHVLSFRDEIGLAAHERREREIDRCTYLPNLFSYCQSESPFALTLLNTAQGQCLAKAKNNCLNSIFFLFAAI